MSNETTVIELPFDLSVEHRAVGMIRHRDGRSAVDCQCGRGCTGTTEAATVARWNAHMAEVAR